MLIGRQHITTVGSDDYKRITPGMSALEKAKKIR
jgi:hypothetical protein